MDNEQKNTQNISKIKVDDVVYDIKDAELRHMIDVLLGKDTSSETSSSDTSTLNDSIQNLD